MQDDDQKRLMDVARALVGHLGEEKLTKLQWLHFYASEHLDLVALDEQTWADRMSLYRTTTSDHGSSKRSPGKLSSADIFDPDED